MDATLTDDHAAALRKLFDGPRHAVTDERIFNGIPLGSSIEAHGHLYLFKWVFGADIEIYTAKLAPYLNAENPDLSAFEKRGGKLVMPLGAADSVVTGLAHGGGPGINQPANLLDTVRAWRETGTAPFALQGRHGENGKAPWEMSLYPYPPRTGWNATTATFQPVDGQRGGVERIAERFRPTATD